MKRICVESDFQHAASREIRKRMKRRAPIIIIIRSWKYDFVKNANRIGINVRLRPLRPALNVYVYHTCNSSSLIREEVLNSPIEARFILLIFPRARVSNERNTFDLDRIPRLMSFLPRVFFFFFLITCQYNSLLGRNLVSNFPWIFARKCFGVCECGPRQRPFSATYTLIFKRSLRVNQPVVVVC